MIPKEHLVEFFLTNYCLQYGGTDFSIGYVASTGDVIVKESVNTLFFEQKRDIDPDKIVWKEWKGSLLPFPESDNNDDEIITMENGVPVIHYDIIFATFYFLSGWNEYVTPYRDTLGRVTYENSIIKKLNIAGLPVVNCYYDIFSTALSLRGIKSLLKEKKNGYPFALTLTHDIDLCNSAWLEGSYNELKEGRLFSIPRLLIKRIQGNDDWFNFKKIITLEKNIMPRLHFIFCR